MDLDAIGGAVLVLARVAGLAATAPAPGLDGRLRIAFAMALGMIVTPVVGPTLDAPADPAALGRLCAGEILAGAMLGLGAALILAAARQAGEIVGMQAGLAPAAILDPDATDGLTPLGHLYGLIAMAVFVAADGPLSLVRVLAESYQTWPVGGAALDVATVAHAFGLVGSALELALRLAAPVALALMLAGVALGLIGRAAPTLQAMNLALPLRSAIGLMLVGLGMTTLIALLAGAWAALPSALVR